MASSESLQALFDRLDEVETQWSDDCASNPHHTAITDASLPGREGLREYPATLALYRICDLVEEATKQELGRGELHEFLEAASALEYSVIHLAYGTSSMDAGSRFIPISCKNIVAEGNRNHQLQGLQPDEESPQEAFVLGFMRALPGLVTRTFGAPDIDPAVLEGPLEEIIQSARNVLRQDLQRKQIYAPRSRPSEAQKYDPESRPSERHSTPLARFCDGRPAIPSDASSQLVAFAEARCEILSGDIARPLRMVVADDTVAVVCADGRADADPMMFLEPVARATASFASFGPDVGLAYVAEKLRLDASRKLAWVGDEDRLKSYRWKYDKEGMGRTLPVHTLDSRGFSDAMIIRGDGARVFRSGENGMAAWDVDSLPTHGPRGTKRVGRKLKQEDFNYQWLRDDTEEIEWSAGSPPSTKLTGKPVSNLLVAENHPGIDTQILGVPRIFREGATSATAVDLQTEKLVMRFFGHGANIGSIATTSGLRTGGDGDPNSFVTAAFDGGIRLYDVRQPTPQFAIDHGSEMLSCALYEYIGGQPFIIYGTQESQQIKVWDVRNRAPLYELATGNNAVFDLAWDATNQTLLAVTQCSNRSRSGAVSGYRWAKIGSYGREWLGGEPRVNNVGDEEEGSENDPDFVHGWPKNAWHAEKSFGVAFDAGRHRMFCYRFKPDANPKILPEYGQTNPAQERSWY